MARRSSGEHSHHHFFIIMVVLLIIAGAIAVRFVSRQDKWTQYVVSSQKQVQQYRTADSVEDAGMIAATIVSVPVGSGTLFENPKTLQAYVEALSHQTGRDIVVIDNKKKILADTVSSNVGSNYSEDMEDETAKTMADGQARDFIEKSTDYPSGISETVISFKNNRGSIVGAIILSNSKIFQ